MPRPRLLNRRGPDGTSTSTRFWNLVTSSDGASAELLIYDEIGYWGTDATTLATALNELNVATIRVRLNSPGGDAFDGVAIYNSLKRSPAKCIVIVDGLAASAASVIAMAGDEIIMGIGSTMMIHDASGMCFGNAADMDQMSLTLDKISQSLAELYADRAGGSAELWRTAMRAESWYSADEAVAAGLADIVEGTEQLPPLPDGELESAMSARWSVPEFRYASRAVAPAPIIPRTAVAPAAPEAPPVCMITRDQFVSSIRSALRPEGK
jgi:ATP-dependent protease ClpP protease subunit